LYTKASTNLNRKGLISPKHTLSRGKCMDRSAIILAGGFSSRFGQDKSLLELNGKPLIKHVVNAVEPIVDEIIIVTSAQERADQYVKVVGPDTKFAIDIDDSKGPLVGTLTGLQQAIGKYSLLLPSDVPFVSRGVVELLFDLCPGRSAVVPRWPNTDIEPLQAVYNTKVALEAAKIAVSEGKQRVAEMLENMQGVRYISTLVIQEIDPDFKTFFNINTPVDLKKAEALIKPKPKKIKTR
jgi:molybdenum cofactor guanylyltransferase